MEADDDGRKLRWRADAWHTGIRRLRDQPVGGFAAPVEPSRSCKRTADGRIDRSEGRDTPWDPLARKGRWRVWNSRRGKPSWPAVNDRINRPDIWMQAIRSDPEKLLWHGGRPHMGPGVRRDDERLRLLQNQIQLELAKVEIIV